MHGTTKEQPRVRFERDERAVLQPLAAHPYRSLVLAPERESRATLYRPTIDAGAVSVERRPLTSYSAMAQIEEVA